MHDSLQSLIAGVTTGAAEGAAALRRCGLALELDAFSVEARLEGDGARPVACIRVDFVMPEGLPPGRG